jgi:hypothetical protein
VPRYGARRQAPLFVSHVKPAGQSVTNLQSVLTGTFGPTEPVLGGAKVGTPYWSTAFAHTPTDEYCGLTQCDPYAQPKSLVHPVVAPGAE